MAEDSDSIGTQSQFSDNDNDNEISKEENRNPTYFVTYNNERSDDITKSLNAIVLQYLDSCGLNNASRAFIEECREGGLIIPDAAQNRANRDADFSVRDAEMLLNAFDIDDGETVHQLWDRLINNFDLTSPNEYTKISFNVRLYVSLIPFYHEYTDIDKAESMAGLRSYFEDTTNSNLADEEMLSLFALPYVQDPRHHSVFRRLFEQSWKDKLRESIVDIIQTFYAQNKLTSQSRTDLAQMFINCSGLLDEAKNGEEKNCDFCACKIPRNATPALHFTSGVTLCNPRPFSEGKTPLLSTNQLFQKIHCLTDDNRQLLDELRKDGERYLQLMKVSNRLVQSLELAVLGKSLDLLQLKQDIETAIPGIFAGIPLTRPGCSRDSLCSVLRSGGSGSAEANYSRSPSATAYVNYDENSKNGKNDINVNVQLLFEDCNNLGDSRTQKSNQNESQNQYQNENHSGSFKWSETEGQNNAYDEKRDLNLNKSAYATNSSTQTTSRKSNQDSVRSQKSIREFRENSLIESGQSSYRSEISMKSRKSVFAKKEMCPPIEEKESGRSLNKGSIRDKQFFDDSQIELDIPPRLMEQRKYRRTIPDPTVSSSGRSEKEDLTLGEGSRTYRMEECDKDINNNKKIQQKKEKALISILQTEKTPMEIKQKIAKAMGSKPVVRKRWNDPKSNPEIVPSNQKERDFRSTKESESLLRRNSITPSTTSSNKVLAMGRNTNLSNTMQEKGKKIEKTPVQSPRPNNPISKSPRTKQLTRNAKKTNLLVDSQVESPRYASNASSMSSSQKKSVCRIKSRDGKLEQQNLSSGRISSSDGTPRKSPRLIPSQTPSVKQFQWISASNYDIPLPAQSFQTPGDTAGFVSRPKLPRSP